MKCIFLKDLLVSLCQRQKEPVRMVVNVIFHILCTSWSHSDEQHMKFVVSLQLTTAQAKGKFPKAAMCL